MPDESELIGALRRQEPQAFNQLFETYSDKLFRVAVGLLQDDDEAEGVVQDTFLRLFEKLDRLSSSGRISRSARGRIQAERTIASKYAAIKSPNCA